MQNQLQNSARGKMTVHCLSMQNFIGNNLKPSIRLITIGEIS